MRSTVAGLIAQSGLPLLEARALLAHRLGVARERLVAHPETTVAAADAEAFVALARRRALGEPLAYLLGEKEFYGRAFAVTPDVLVPRPETELLVDLALERMRAIERPRVLDLGTGSGCVAVTLALECPAAQVTATDACAGALAIARRNAERLGAAVAFRSGDWYDALPVDATFDLILSNPPYVAAGDPHLDDLRFEPMRALTDGRDGLACLEAIAAGAGQATVAWRVAAGGTRVRPGRGRGGAVRPKRPERGGARGRRRAPARDPRAGQASPGLTRAARSLHSLELLPCKSAVMDAKEFIQKTVTENPVVLFMKGTAQFPQCGFSGRAIQLLKQAGAKNLVTVNVLEDDGVRQGIKDFANWPTIPQLYVNGQFVGGSDIMTEMFESGELQTLVREAESA